MGDDLQPAAGNEQEPPHGKSAWLFQVNTVAQNILEDQQHHISFGQLQIGAHGQEFLHQHIFEILDRSQGFIFFNQQKPGVFSQKHQIEGFFGGNAVK